MAFAVKYRTEFTDILGVDWRVDIEKNNYVGSILQMQTTGNPLRIEYLTPSDDLLSDPIKGSTAKLNIECTTNFQYIDLYNEADMTYKFKVYYGSTPTLYWQGWVSNDYSEPYDTVPYTVSITALDGLGLLKYIDFKNGSSIYSGRAYESTVILNVLSKIGYTEFDEYVNLYDFYINNGVTDTPFNQIQLEQLVFEGEDCYTVLVEILKHYNAIIRQKNGRFVIYRPSELVNDTVYGRRITSSTITGISLTPDQYLYREGENTSNFRDFNGGMLMFKSPASTVRGLQNYNQAGSWIKNHNFNISTYNEATSQFANWNYSLSDGKFVKISNIDGWQNEMNGVATTYSGVAKYLYQEFGPYVNPTTDILEFSFDYMFKNTSTSNINTRIYIRIKDTANNVWLTNKINSNTELDEASSSNYIMTDEMSIEPGMGQWNTWKRYKIGLTNSGTYQIYIQTTLHADLTLGIKNVVFRATSDKIVKRSLPKLKKWYNLAIGTSFASLWGYFVKNNKFYDINDEIEIVEREYIKDNSINGEKPDITYELGDVSDTDIDDVIDQFNGSLSINTTSSLKTIASIFVKKNASAYATGGVNVTSTDNKIRFTSAVAGTDFTGSTTITNVSGNLSGTVTNIQPNLTAVARIDEITLSGTNGELYITCDGTSRMLFFNGSIDQSGADFVSNFAASYAAGGVTVTYNSFSNKLIFTSSVAGQDFTGSTTAVTNDGDFAGSVVYATANRAAQARIDEITLSGTSGSANITCDAVTKLAVFATILRHTESWSTRGNSEESNLLELLIDEIALMKSKGRHFIQLNLYEFNSSEMLSLISNLQDPINLSGANYRVFIPTRGEYNVRDREWTVDLLEIAEKAAP